MFPFIPSFASPLNTETRYKDDQSFLMQHLSEFAFLKDFKYSLPVTDELTRGLIEMCETKKVPIWLAFATQIFLDIKNIIRPQPNKAFNDLKMTGLRTKKIINDHFKFHETMPDQHEENWPSGNNIILRQVQQIIEDFIENDWFLSCMRKDIQRAGNTTEDYALYKSDPLLCGVLVFHLNIRMQELGLILMNAWGTGLYAAYLYNAIQQDASEMDVQWQDMDKLIELHSEEHLFYGPRPTNHEDAFRKICIATGIDASAFAGGAKFPRHARKTREARGLEEMSVISKVYRNRYCYGETIDLSTKNVERVLNDLANKKTAAEAGSKRLRRKFKKTQKLSPLQLLAALQERLYDEEQSLKFNYLGMNTRTIILFKTVKKAVDPQMASKFGKDYCNDERQICAVVHFILTYASLAIQGTRAMGLHRGNDVKFGSKAVYAAGQVLKDWAKTNGAIGVKELDAFCANKPKLDTLARAREREKQFMQCISLVDMMQYAAEGGSSDLGAMAERFSSTDMSWKPM